jgi:hypothetical protein
MSPDRRIETIRDVPETAVDGVMRDFKDSGATKVIKTQQPDKKWTIEAQFESGAQYPASGAPAA